jgi:hypothetical protein
VASTIDRNLAAARVIGENLMRDAPAVGDVLHTVHAALVYGNAD